MQLHKQNSGAAGRRLRLEQAAKELAASGADRKEIMDILDSVGARRPEVTGAIAVAMASLDGVV